VTAEVLDARPGEHVVVFHHDNDVAELVGAYALGAIRDGGSAIIVATPEHRLWVNAFLMQAGIDLAGAIASGPYVVLDAGQTLESVLVGGWPDPAAFWTVFSPVLAAAAKGRRPVRVFGEMVALLWETGAVEAAIELEALWNELLRQFSFALLCAYPLAAVGAAEHSDALAHVRHAHSGVCGIPTA
jgi:MEDS: MEthanogen/methylotroph, DcmR Sensory domain